MPNARRAQLLALGLLLAGCSHAAADARPPEPPTPGPAATMRTPPAKGVDGPAAEDGPDEAAPAQQVTFGDDADAEPTSQVRGAPKRPPLPRFRLFGTREDDGP